MSEQPAVGPHRGDVYWVDFEPARGSEQGGARPALIIQNDRGNRTARYTVVAAISSAPLPLVYPFTVAIPTGVAGLRSGSHVNCAQLMTIDKGRLGRRMGALSDTVMTSVDEALRYELEL